ncbi:hypothetical protein Droror1_Dr00017186 [Drosera rotundifolia]
MNQICACSVTYVTKRTSLEENKKAELSVVVSRANSVIKKMAEHGEVWDFVEVKLQFLSKEPEARLWGYGESGFGRLIWLVRVEELEGQEVHFLPWSGFLEYKLLPGSTQLKLLTCHLLRAQHSLYI